MIGVAGKNEEQIRKAIQINHNTLSDFFIAGETYDYAFSTADLRAVPEPATWTMLLMGMGLVGAAFRRRARGPA